MTTTAAPLGSLDEITADWLTTALHAAGVLPDTGRVTDLSTTRIGSGQLGATYLLSPVFESAGPETPERLVAKLPAEDEESRQTAASLGCYTREVAFYRDLADDLAVRTPRCYHAWASDDGTSFCLLLEDLTPASECSQLDGCDPARAAVALEQAAALHAGSWRDPSMTRHDWLTTGLGVWQHMCASLAQVQPVFRERYADLLDDTTVRISRALESSPAAGRWVERLAEPRCLWHSDFRLDNLLFDARDGEVPLAVVDWQSVLSATGTVDASYFIGAGLTTELRREHEETLLRGYHDALVGRGVTDYTWEDCLAEYRLNAIAGFVISTVVSVGTERSPGADALFTTMASRHAAHMADCDTIALLEQS